MSNWRRHQSDRGQRQDDWRQHKSQRDWSSERCGSSARGRGGRHPSGLKGRDIGMFYKNQSVKKAAKNRSVLYLDQKQHRKLTVLQQEMNELEPRGPSFKVEEGPSEFMRKYHQHLDANNEFFQERKTSKHDFESNPEVSNDFKHLLELQQNAPKYVQMMGKRKCLPAYEKRSELVKIISQNQVVVVSGETGCGKTTQVPQFVLDDAILNGKGSETKIICTQPRRISAISVAERVAEERGEPLGTTVGFQIRLETRLPRDRGSITYCTTGIVLQQMRTNKTLQGISHIILDEIHERDIQSDFLISLLKDLLSLRPDLKVVLMSATLNAQKFSRFFGNCPTINIPGFTYPVEELYLEDVLQWLGYRFQETKSQNRPSNYRRGRRVQKSINDVHLDFIEPYLRNIEGEYSDHVIRSLSSPGSESLDLDLVATLIHQIDRTKPDGAILVFLTGWTEISQLHKMLTEKGQFKFDNRVRVFPLHSLMPTANQRQIFEKPPKGVRKIVLSTNIAETSITIEDVVYVIDCGKIKLTNFDWRSNIATLQPEWVSLANAKQRKGRAGRVQPGICYHLFTRAREMAMESYLLPEILRVRLDQVILNIKIMELGSVDTFLSKVMDPPEPESVKVAMSMLRSINALNPKTEELSPLGYHLAQLPMDPQTGKMVLFGAIFSCLDPVLSVAASLSFKDAFLIPMGKEEMCDRRRRELSNGTKSDHLMFANVMFDWEDAVASGNSHGFCWKNFLSENTLKMLDKMKGQFAEYLCNAKFVKSHDVKCPDSNINSDNEGLVRAVICAGLYPNVALVKLHNTKRNGKFIRLSTKDDKKRAKIHPKSVNAKETEYAYPWMVYHQKVRSTDTFLHDCSMISPLALAFFGEYVKPGSEVVDGETFNTLSVDAFVKFNCEPSTSNVVKELRKSLDELLEYKVSHPGQSNWSSSSKEGALLRAITELLTAEVKGITLECDNDDDDDI